MQLSRYKNESCHMPSQNFLVNDTTCTQSTFSNSTSSLLFCTHWPTILPDGPVVSMVTVFPQNSRHVCVCMGVSQNSPLSPLVYSSWLNTVTGGCYYYSNVLGTIYCFPVGIIGSLCSLNTHINPVKLKYSKIHCSQWKKKRFVLLAGALLVYFVPWPCYR